LPDGKTQLSDIAISTMSSHGVAVVLVDPVNEFLDPEGKLYPLVKESLATSNTVGNIRKVLQRAREEKIPIYYGLHKQYEEGVYDGWKHMRASHHRILKLHAFSGWGGEVVDEFTPSRANGDVVASRHWNSR
jgi:nicotinamidase-related amidase